MVSGGIMGGMKEGGETAINMSKTSEVLQGPDESPSQFCERLCEAFHLYTPFDLEAPENQQMIDAAFVVQAQGDRKQKLEGFAGVNTTRLLEVATKVFVNQDQEAKREADRKMKTEVYLLAAAPAGQSDGPR
jgi:hypothetical protein